MTALNIVDPPNKFHMAINVVDLDRAIEFYRVLFDRAPAKHYKDYAKFEVDNPPTIFSLNPMPFLPGGVLSHIGLRVPSEDMIWEARSRLEEAGYKTQTQEDTKGCYALQTKVWVKDPDGNDWEIYVLKEDLLPEDSARSTSMLPMADEASEPEFRQLVYKGPFKELVDESGRIFHRGKRLSVPLPVWEDLLHGPTADAFIFYSPSESSDCGA
jgi:catechol 2,3-dioxygenase-like lactoylglutathione lyase family enzyme